MSSFFEQVKLVMLVELESMWEVSLKILVNSGCSALPSVVISKFEMMKGVHCK